MATAACSRWALLAAVSVSLLLRMTRAAHTCGLQQQFAVARGYTAAPPLTGLPGFSAWQYLQQSGQEAKVAKAVAGHVCYTCTDIAVAVPWVVPGAQWHLMLLNK